ncbi:MAG: hypothetical protein ACJA2J_002474 [Candidatus Azotimanducaceae bacterium]|jgi:hypothetical protein
MFTQYLAATSSIMPIAISLAVFTVSHLVAFALWTFNGDKFAQAFRKKLVNTALFRRCLRYHWALKVDHIDYYTLVKAGI